MDNLQERKYSLKTLHSLKSLCRMLRNNADQILAAEMSVTMASTTLYELNEAIDNLQDGLSPSSLAVDLTVGATDNSGSGSNSGGNNGGGGPLSSSRMRTSDLEEWNFHLQLVLDIVSKAPVLVVYKPDAHSLAAVKSSASTSPSQPLRLGYFTSLSHLEISCVPIRSIQDLLKMRERLRTLVVVNCFASNFHLQDVLEVCDQGVSVPMQWAVLRNLCVRNNNITRLDGALRLCPRLELLDLSRNSLMTTDVYLGYLMELTHLDLSHNRLTRLPSVSATAKKKLKILRLAGNKIACLSGVDEMTSLQELDLSENLITTHHCLQPIKGLHRLDRLNMRGCPLTMKKDHRVLALQFISTVSLSRKFFLDGHHVTHKEIQNSRAVINHAVEPAPRLRQPNPPSLAPIGSRPAGDHSSLPPPGEGRELPSSTTEDSTVGVTSIRKKKGRKKAKARTMDIPDMDLSGGDMSSEVTPSTTPKVASRMEALAELRRQEVRETRAEMENYRRHYGENWLQAIEDQGLLPLPASTANTPTTTTFLSTTSTTTTATQRKTLRKSVTDVAMVKSVTVDVHAEDSGSKARSLRTSELAAPTAQAMSTSESARNLVGKAFSGEDDSLRPSAQMWGRKASSGEDDSLLHPSAQSLGEKVFNKEDLFLSSGSGAEDGGPSSLTPCAPSKLSTTGDFDTGGGGGADDGGGVGGNTGTEGGVQGGGSSASVGQKEGAVEGGREDSSAAVGQRSESSLYGTRDSMVEPEEQSEPFIVTLPHHPDDPFMIAVSPRYLVEKDICGVITDKLDLQSLEAVRTEVEESVYKPEGVTEGDGATGSDPQEVKVILDFTSVCKDRQCRAYVMEDFITAQHLYGLVQPFVDAKVEAARKKMEVMYQCLKCSSSFTRGEATEVVYMESIPHTGSIKDFSSMAHIGGERLRLQCPKCGSDHIVLMEDDPPHLPPSPSTVSSSLPSGGPLHNAFFCKQSLDQLGEAQSPPNAHSTPLKGQGSLESLDANPLTRSGDHRESRSSVSRGLFSSGVGDKAPREGSDPRQMGGRLAVVESSLLSSSVSTTKQVEESLPSRRRSDAFCEQSPLAEARRRSDAVASLWEYQERLSSSSGSLAATAQRQNTEGRRLSTTGSTSTAGMRQRQEEAEGRRLSTASGVASADDVYHLSRFGVPNPSIGAHLASSANGSEWAPAWRNLASSSSVESDITILNKRQDSVGSAVVVIASSHVSGADVSEAGPSPRQSSAPSPWAVSGSSRTESSDVVLIPGGGGGSDTESEKDGGDGPARRDALRPDRWQEDEEGRGGGGGGGGSVEVTPLGSPLSQSICSSMVSSVYTNSLLPATSPSDAYLTANEYTTATTNTTTSTEEEEEGESRGDSVGEEEETSIYDLGGDDAVRVPRSRSSHKPSVSSEVEVLLVEEDPNQMQDNNNNDDDDDDGSSSPSPNEGENTTTATNNVGVDTNTVNIDSTAAEGDTDDSTDGAAAAVEVVGGAVGDGLGVDVDSEGASYDLKSLDHQLALYLMMSVFDNDENFKFKVKTCVSQYMMLEEYDALVTVTNMKLYILRINTEDPSVELSESLTLMEAQPLAELKQLDVGLGHMTLRLEFVSDCSSYTLVMRDSTLVDTFAEMLSDQLQAYTMETGVPMSVVVSEGADQSTLDALSANVLDRGGNSGQSLRLYILGYIARGHNPLYPMAFVVSSSSVCLVRTNHQWPSPYHHTKVTVDSVGKQFTVLERCAINTIATLEVSEASQRHLRVTFFNESSVDETRWLVTMETRKGVRDFVEAVREPWETEFGVPLDVESSPFDFF